MIACVTPKYVTSHYCNRELGLSDLLRKPIIPVMYDKVPWPPPGGMSLMLAQLVYINMKGEQCLITMYEIIYRVVVYISRLYLLRCLKIRLWGKS